MLQYFEKNWWLWLLRGVIAWLFAGLAFSLPSLGFTGIVLVLSAFMFADGFFALLSLFARRTDERWSWYVFFEGIAGMAAGIVACVVAREGMLPLLYCIAAWAMLSGIFKLGVALHCRKAACVPGSWLLGFVSIASLALGISLGFFPRQGLTSLGLFIASYAGIYGLLMLAEGLRLRRFYRIFDVKKVHLQIQQPYYPA